MDSKETKSAGRSEENKGLKGFGNLQSKGHTSFFRNRFFDQKLICGLPL